VEIIIAQEVAVPAERTSIVNLELAKIATLLVQVLPIVEPVTIVQEHGQVVAQEAKPVLMVRAKILAVILLVILQNVKLVKMERAHLLVILQNVKPVIMERVNLLVILQNVKPVKMAVVLLLVAPVKLVTMELVKILILVKMEKYNAV